MIRKPYTFHPNEPDDIHCLQAVFRMVYEGLLDEKLTLEQAEKMTNFIPGKSSWPFMAMLSALQSGLTVRSIEKNLDADLYATDYRAAILKQTTPEMLHIFEETTDVASISRVVAQTLTYKNMHYEDREPTWEDILRYINQSDTAVTCNVNARALYGNREGWNGHFVLVVDIDDDKVILDDPGNPPEEHAEVSKENFLNAWSRAPAMANLIIFSKE